MGQDKSKLNDMLQITGSFAILKRIAKSVIIHISFLSIPFPDSFPCSNQTAPKIPSLPKYEFFNILKRKAIVYKFLDNKAMHAMSMYLYQLTIAYLS